MFIFYLRYTNKTVDGQKVVYAILLKWPKGNMLNIGSPFPSVQTTTVSLIGYGPKLSWKPYGSQGMMITIPEIEDDMMPCKWAWVFKLEGLINRSRNPDHPVYFPEFEMYKPRHRKFDPAKPSKSTKPSKPYKPSKPTKPIVTVN